MQHFRICAFAILIMSLCMHSCKVPNVPVSDGLKAAFMFKTGSYWIFREQAGATDSLYVTGEDVQSAVKGQPYHRQSTHDIITVHIASVRTDSTSALGNHNWDISMLDHSFQLKGNIDNRAGYPLYGSKYTAIDFPFTAHESNGEFVSVLGDYANSGVSFSGVAIASLKSTLNSPANDTFYFNPDVFFIKMKLGNSVSHTNTELSLVRWHLER